MNLRNYRTAKLLLTLLGTLGGCSVLPAQLISPNWPPPLPAGPYALGFDPGNGSAVDEPIPGFVGPAGAGVAPYGGENLEQTVNPAFVEWASSVVNYAPARPDMIEADFLDPTTALGPVTGSVFDVVSLGDLSAADIAEDAAPGSLTVGFATPMADGPGPDFVVFGNAFSVRGHANQVFSKLAFVEVSSDGVNFARFPSVDTNPRPLQNPWSYMVSNPTLIYNLFGKAVNGYGVSWGVPFDLAQLSQHPLVAAGLLDLQNVRFVRLVAVVGNGAYSTDAYGHPIYDPWPTSGSPGPEVQAIGVLNVAPPPNPAPANTTTPPALANSAQSGGGLALVSSAGVRANNSSPLAARSASSSVVSGYAGLSFSLADYTGVNSADLSSASWTPVTTIADAGVDGSSSADAPLAPSGVATTRTMASKRNAGVTVPTGSVESPAGSSAAGSSMETGPASASAALTRPPLTENVVAPLPPASTRGFSTGWRLTISVLALAFLAGLAGWKRLAH
jgi:hypothetical protein